MCTHGRMLTPATDAEPTPQHSRRGTLPASSVAHTIQMITMRHSRTVGHAMPELIHLRLAISAGVVQSLAVMGSTATGRIWLDAADDHSSNGEVDGGVVHPASNGRQMQADGVEQRYRRLADHSPDAIAVHEGGRVVYVNHAGGRWIGAQASAELGGHVITEFVHPASVPARLR